MATSPKTPQSEASHAELKTHLSVDPVVSPDLKSIILSAATCYICKEHMLQGTLVGYPCGLHLVHKKCWDSMGDAVGNAKCELCHIEFDSKLCFEYRQTDPFNMLLRSVLAVRCEPQINDPINDKCTRSFLLGDKTGKEKHRQTDCPYAKRCCMYCGLLLSPNDMFAHPCKIEKYDGSLIKSDGDDSDDDEVKVISSAPAAAAGAGGGGASASASSSSSGGSFKSRLQTKKRRRQTISERMAGVRPGATGDDDSEYSDSDESNGKTKKHKH